MGQNCVKTEICCTYSIKYFFLCGFGLGIVIMDLAGSEGESALGPDFARQVPRATLLARRLEAGCINIGLSDLQVTDKFSLLFFALYVHI